MLNKKYRLTKNGSFQYVYRKGKPQFSGAITLTYIPCKGAPKIGFSVPNKVGNAVVRNKLKRRMRAAVERQMYRLCPVQAVFSAKNGADKLSYAEVQSAVILLFERAKLFNNREAVKL